MLVSQSGAIPEHVLTVVHNPSDHSLRLSSEPTPSPDENQYLIRVSATSLTSGELVWPEPNSLLDPIPGFDFSGTILTPPKAPPPNDSQPHLPPSTKVFGLTSFSRRGNARGITVAAAGELARMPPALGFDEAATIPLSALTAWQALFVHAGLRPAAGANRDARVLVTAAAGGVGSWAVQLAAWAGAQVTGTCGARNVEFVRGLVPAAEVLDYASVGVAAWVAEDARRRFDVVVDCVGGKTLEGAWKAARSDGFVVSVAQPAESARPARGVRDGVRSCWFIVEPDAAQLEAIGNLVQAGLVRGQVDSVWEMEEYQAAWKKVSEGHARGKVVLRCKST
jgi:NADPH:quinone reductase-like Zn-dependent oxidoreductase